MAPCSGEVSTPTTSQCGLNFNKHNLQRPKPEQNLCKLGSCCVCFSSSAIRQLNVHMSADDMGCQKASDPSGAGCPGVVNHPVCGCASSIYCACAPAPTAAQKPSFRSQFSSSRVWVLNSARQTCQRAPWPTELSCRSCSLLHAAQLISRQRECFHLFVSVMMHENLIFQHLWISYITHLLIFAILRRNYGSPI